MVWIVVAVVEKVGLALALVKEVAVVVAIVFVSAVVVGLSLVKVAHRSKIASAVHVPPCKVPVSVGNPRRTFSQPDDHPQQPVSEVLVLEELADYSFDVVQPWPRAL